MEYDKQFAKAKDQLSYSNTLANDCALPAVAAAQVHATLALAEAAQRIGDILESIYHRQP